MSRRVLVVSPFGPPHHGGLESYIDWLHGALESHGASVRMLSTNVREVDADYTVGAIDVPVGGGTSWPLVLPGRGTRATIRSSLEWADIVIHQNCFWNLTALVSRMAARHGVPQYTVVHAAYRTYPGAGFVTSSFAWAYGTSIGRSQLRRAPAIAVSASTQRFVEREYGVPALLAPCPLPAPNGEVAASGPSVHDGPPRIAWVGRMVPVKAPDIAVRVGDALAAHGGIEMHFYGGGPLEETIPARPWLHVHGALPREDVLREVARADLFFSTSRADNVQVALLEALSLGVPCVATRVGEADEYLVGPLARGLVEVDDVGGMVMAIRDVLASGQDMRQDARLRGAELVAEHDPDRAARRMAELLDL